MLRSSNPVLSRQDAFTPAAPQYGRQPVRPVPYGYPQYPGQPYAGQAPVQAPKAG